MDRDVVRMVTSFPLPLSAAVDMAAAIGVITWSSTTLTGISRLTTAALAWILALAVLSAGLWLLGGS